MYSAILLDNVSVLSKLAPFNTLRDMILNQISTMFSQLAEVGV
jgi:hypothetical protein